MPFWGLAPFLRLNTAGSNLREVTEHLLQRTDQEPDNANLWMNLATAFFSMNQPDMGFAMQEHALGMQRTYQIAAAVQPARFRLLVLMAAGDLAENTPIDCLLENSRVDLIFYYASVQNPLPSPLPAHDAVLVAISDTDDSRPILHALEAALCGVSTPVLNAPQHIPNVERSAASELLQQVPGLQMPPTQPVTRQTLQAVASGQVGLAEVLAGCQFPIILRPVGSHAGRDLHKVDDAQGVARYLSEIADTAFYLSRFIDYRSDDGLFRKYRVALIAGQPFACHMAISSHWMIHYVNAGMYEDSAKRAQEATWMATFADFAHRHATALQAIAQRSKLDYVCVDCAETCEGELLIFEIDHAMVVHAMDSEALFPYKQTHMLKVKEAFEAFLFSLGAAQPHTL